MTVQNKTLQIVLVTENKIVGIVICYPLWEGERHEHILYIVSIDGVCRICAVRNRSIKGG